MNEIVLCDADDTIEDLLGCWLRRLNRDHGTNYRPEDIKGWTLHEYIKDIPQQEIYDPLFCKDFWRDLEPIEGCFDVLKRINEQKTLYIVTASNFATIDAKAQRIIEMYPFLSSKQFIVAQNKQVIRGDYLIDDGYHNLIGGAYQGILFDRPHNRSFDENAAGLFRAKSWSEIEKIIFGKEER